VAANTPPRQTPARLAQVRLLFERTTNLGLKPRKMRFFFKRWLEFEVKWGGVADQEKVQERARTYVASLEAKQQMASEQGREEEMV
jgi:hypothetical protein